MAVLPQSHDCSCYVCRWIMAPLPLWLQKTHWSTRTLSTCDISRGSLTLPTPKAGDFVKYSLLYLYIVFADAWVQLCKVAGNACYHSVEHFVILLLPGCADVTMCKIILPVVLCGLETWYISSVKEYRLGVLMAKLRGSKRRLKKLRHEDLPKFYSSK
jgi:hypothetical protein